MNKITVVSGTNRPNSNTKIVAQSIVELLRKLDDKAEIHEIYLDEYPSDFIHTEMYSGEKQVKWLSDIQDTKLSPVPKYIFVAPEYNGSYPGVLKAFLDALSVRDYKGTFGGKKAALFGVASGRAGNLRGIDQLGAVLNYLGVTTCPQALLPISSVKGLVENGELTDAGTLEAIETSLKAFLKF